MGSDSLYALIIRATLAAAVLLALVAGTTAFAVGAPLMSVWVGVAAVAAMYARKRLQVTQTA